MNLRLPAPAPRGWEQTEQAAKESAHRQMRLPTHLAGARAAHRPHASAARALRGHGLADRRRQRLRQRAAHRRAGAAPAFPRDRGAALQEPRADPRDRAGAVAYARATAGLRLAAEKRSGQSNTYRRVVTARSVQRRLEALGRGAVVLRAAHLALGELGENRAGGRQALALHVARRSHSFERTIALAHW